MLSPPMLTAATAQIGFSSVRGLRRHLLTFMTLRQPGALFRLMVLLGQVALVYLHPAFCSIQQLVAR
jgi:hypothetical protein